ncbi:MAG: HAD hydrolase family protein [Candidatus Binatia bacterium]
MAAREIELRARAIRVLVVDVDGVLTDGRIVVDAQGREARTFHEGDRTGVRLLVRAGLAVVGLEGRRLRTRPAYARTLALTEVLEGAGEGLASARRYSRRRRLALEQVAYVGHDVPDLPLLAAVGLAVVVANAPEAVRRGAHFVTASRGGEGVVREVGERILRAQGKWASTLGETWRHWD